MALLESLRKSSINIQSISKTLSDTKKSTSSVNESVDNISRIVATNTRVKRELFARSNVLSSRREEASKRQELEDRLESTKVSTSPQLGLSFTSRSDKGPLGRLLGFLGFITAGWIVENLPRWIFMGQEFISRIYSFGRSMYSMVNSMQVIIKSFGQTLGYSLDAIVRLDFDQFAGEGTVARSFEELNLAVQDLGTNITDTFKLFTTPLTESLETGEKAPGLEEKQPDTMFPPIPQERGTSPITPYTGPETTSSGVLNPQAAYSHLRQMGVSHIHALGILANIQGESSFKIAADENGRGTAGIGLFQYTFPSRKRRFLQAVPDWRNNWKAQIDYAIKNDENTPLYLKKQFSSPEEAADDFMRNWENPSKDVYTQRRKIHNSFIKSFRSPSKEKTSQASNVITPPQAQSKKSTLDLKKLGFSVGEKAGYSPSRGRIHAGRDIAIDKGTPVSVISDAKITDVGYESGYGYFVAYLDSKGIEHFYGHLREMPKVKKGQQLSSGTIVGYVGSTGSSTGPHLHWEVSPRLGEVGRPRKNIIDPIEYGFSASSPFGGTPPAQISAQPKPSQPSAITPERKGSQMVLIDATKPSQPQVSYPSQQQPSVTPTISEFKLLNNFIKNKLLLDLAYL
jgi:murein DD-endopeptidase MepM/ murein hydrolase activator NlpD